MAAHISESDSTFNCVPRLDGHSLNAYFQALGLRERLRKVLALPARGVLRIVHLHCGPRREQRPERVTHDGQLILHFAPSDVSTVPGCGPWGIPCGCNVTDPTSIPLRAL